MVSPSAEERESCSDPTSAHSRRRAVTPTSIHLWPFAPPDCVVESQPFAEPLEVAAGDRVEITLDYDLSFTVFSGHPTYSVQCLAEASGSACFSDCADFGGGRTCAGPPAFAGRAKVSH